MGLRGGEWWVGGVEGRGVVGGWVEERGVVGGWG